MVSGRKGESPCADPKLPGRAARGTYNVEPADVPFMIFNSASEHRAVTGRKRMRTEGKQGSSAYIRGLHCELQSCP